METEESSSTAAYAILPPRYAGFWIRLGAQIVDAIILAVGTVITGVVFALLLTGQSEQTYLTGLLLLIIPFLATIWLYNALFESSRHMGTPGKIFFGIKVTDMKGNRIGFARATVRYIFKNGIVSILRFIGSSFTCMAFIYDLADTFLLIASENKQSIHDMIAGTLVVYE